MTVRLIIRSGARARLVRSFQGDVITLGRHPESDLQLDPEADLHVSARHAVIERTADGWIVRDSGSRNGTLVNGIAIAGPTRLRHGDRIGLGSEGPVIEFRLAASSASRRALALAFGMVVLALFLAGLAARLFSDARRERIAWERERAELLHRIDSIVDAGERAIASLEGRIEGLASALRESQQRARQLGAELSRAEARGDSSEAAELRRRLQAVTAALHRQQMAAALDYHAIQGDNHPAIAVVFAEAPNGTVSTATAFAVRPNGTLVTAGHAVAGEDGRTHARRIGIQFSGSHQVWPARILIIAQDADLALLKIDNVLGDVPTIRSISARPDTIPAGAPVAILGFPLGGDTTEGGSAPRLPRPLLTAGVLTDRAAARLEVQGYGAAGASGSPIFDANGEVIGVLFGGRHDLGGQTILAVPAVAALRLLESVSGTPALSRP